MDNNSLGVLTSLGFDILTAVLIGLGWLLIRRKRGDRDGVKVINRQDTLSRTHMMFLEDTIVGGVPTESNYISKTKELPHQHQQRHFSQPLSHTSEGGKDHTPHFGGAGASPAEGEGSGNDRVTSVFQNILQATKQKGAGSKGKKKQDEKKLNKQIMK